MTANNKSVIRKIIYIILISLCIAAFIYIGNKYTNNSKERVITMRDYYKDLLYDHYKVVGGNELISLIRKGKNIILIGSSNNKWSIKYIEELDPILNNYDINQVFYYDIVNDKSQKNSNYYKIISLLDGYLVSTDGGNNNLLSPSLYIIEDGKVLYYNVDTTAMKNTKDIEDYWDNDTKTTFETEISHAFLNYYLNN